MFNSNLIDLEELTISQSPERPNKNTPPLPITLIKHRISAGFPSPAGDYIEESLDLNQYLIRNKPATFIFSVKGDSMINASIDEGDKVIVDRSLKAKHNDIVIAVIDANYTIKRLYKSHGIVELRPENPSYQAIKFNNGSELQIWGVVIGVVRRYTSKRIS